MYEFFDEKGLLLSNEQIKNACNGHQDYYVAGPSVGGVELLGKRDSQEDRMIFCELHRTARLQFSSLSDEQKLQLFQTTFAMMQQHIVANLKSADVWRQGATAVVAWLEIATQTCWSASLGDGQIFAVHLFADGTLKAVQELNYRHNPEEPREMQRLTQHAMQADKQLDDVAPICGGSKRRLAGILAVSRAFGDTDYDVHGMIHEPEIQKTQPLVLAGEKVFIVSACDGLTENDAITPAMLGEYISIHHRTQNYGLMAHGLGELAVQGGSRDNISVQIATLSEPNEESVRMLAIFDGHGGPLVAEHLKSHFESVFLSCLASRFQSA